VATIRTDAGDGHSVPINVGIDTAEWALPCADATTAAQHKAAVRFGIEAAAAAGGCRGAFYFADKAVDFPRAGVISVDWSARDHPRAALRIDHVTVFDASGRSYALGVDDSVDGHWVERRMPSGEVAWENERALPLAWLVHALTRLSGPSSEIAAIQTGLLVGWRYFEPSELAITSDPRAGAELAAASSTSAAGDRVQVERWRGSSKRFSVTATSNAILVISNRYFPGWSARVDGADVPIVRVDAILQGIPVSPGTHRVELDFRPSNFAWLLFVGICAFVTTTWLVLRRSRGIPADR
jgi:hypothetical protein